MEIAPFEDSVDRVGGAQELIDAVNQLQNYGMVKQQLNKGSVKKRNVYNSFQYIFKTYFEG